MTAPLARPPVRRDAGITLRLLFILLVIFAGSVAAFGLIAQSVIDRARAQQLEDARTHFEARLAAMDAGWRASAFALRQQAELWLAGADRAAPEMRDARLRTLLVTVLDQMDFTHAVVVGADGKPLFRHGTRSQDMPALPTTLDGDGSGWVYSERDALVYRTISGPLAFAGQRATMVLYAPLDHALLARLVYPSTHLSLLHDNRVLAESDFGTPNRGPATDADAPETAGLTLRWDAAADAPSLRIARRFASPLTPRQLLLIVAGSAVSFIVVGWFALGRWVRAQALRLSTLQAATTAFATTPAISPELQHGLDAVANQHDDIGLLGEHLNTMMRRIEEGQREQAQAQQALASLNASLEARVAERTRELAQARDEALAAARAKERFLSTMSHEIRTPMNGLLGALELISATPVDPRQAQLLQVAATSAKALLDVVNEVLDFAKIGAGQLRLSREPIDIVAVARSVTVLFSASAQRKAIELRLEVDASLSGWRLGDALRLRQVLLNLVGNALKFTPRGEVVVRLRDAGGPTGDRVAFEVSDTGVGIAATQQALIFEPFLQAETSESRGRQGGTGLGLAISREIVRNMGGELEVHSEPGRGARFSFELQLERATEAGPAPPPAVAATAPPEALRGCVLLVEDNSVNRLVGSAMLENLGLEVLMAEDGEQALAVLATRPVSLVLMDCEMPVMDGYEATQRLRQRERDEGKPRTPVVALTANVLSGEVERCLAAGMDAHLAKPYTTQQLRAVILSWGTPPQPG